MMRWRGLLYHPSEWSNIIQLFSSDEVGLSLRWSGRGDTGDTKLDILLFLSDFAQKPVLLGVVAELLLQVQIILMGISRREMEGPALGCLP